MTDQENEFGTWINNLEMNGGTIEGTSAANKGVGIAFQKLNMTAGKLVGNGKVAAIQLRADEKINDINSVFQIPEGYLSDEYEFQTYDVEFSSGIRTRGAFVLVGEKLNINDEKVPTNAIKKITLEAQTTHIHTWNKEWKTDNNKHWHECECGAKSDEAEHTHKVINAKEATTKEEGYTGDTICGICGHEISKGKVIPIVKEEQKPQEEIKNPQTSDNIFKYGMIFVTAFIGLVGSIFVSKKKLAKNN